MQSSPALKTVVVDDHVLIRNALRGVLRDLRPESTVLEAPNADVLAALLWMPSTR